MTDQEIRDLDKSIEADLDKMFVVEEAPPEVPSSPDEGKPASGENTR